MKTSALTIAALVTTAHAVEPIPFLNVVDTSKSCNLDTDCTVEDVAYIEGRGKPTSTSAICCASFPREMWNEGSQSYKKTTTKHCYSKTILENKSEFNYYKQAYCDSALQGMTALATMGAAVMALMAF